MKDTLCDTCSIPIDYTQGFVRCYYRFVFLHKGYKNCKGYNKGPHIIKFPGSPPIKVESFTSPIEVSPSSEASEQ